MSREAFEAALNALPAQKRWGTPKQLAWEAWQAARAAALEWLDALAEADEIDTALVFGTLKALPSGLPDSMQAHWIDGGIVGQMREAA